MHAGFSALRSNMGMNVRHSFPGIGMTPEVAADIARIDALWNDSLRRYGGPFLLRRLQHRRRHVCAGCDALQNLCRYAVRSGASAMQTRLLALPAMRAWYAEAEAETEVLPQYEHQR